MAGISCLAPGEGDDRAQGSCGLPAVAEREVEGLVFPLCEEHTRELDAERGPVKPGSRVKKRDADVAPVRAVGASPLGVNWIGRAEIINTEERNAQYPEFRINSRRERDSLRPGDFAKLVWEGLNGDGLIGGERMWVEVTKATKGRKGCTYEGALRNTPVSMRVPKKVRFGPEHIANIQAAEAQRNCLAPRSDDLSGRGEHPCGKPAVDERECVGLIFPLCRKHTKELDAGGAIYQALGNYAVCIKARDKFACVYCHSGEADELSLGRDLYLVPFSSKKTRGADLPRNLLVACKACKETRSDR